ncbi:Tubby-like F-box protein 5 [Citrus sinensis]|nr:Tubby-like F-box protein 5 [Citrus sinensis]
MSKLLLAARKIRKATSTDFLISLVGDDFSRTSNTYVGKLRSNFLGTKFTIYDSQPPCDTAIHSNSRSQRKIFPKQVSLKGSSSNYSVATISYELNVLQGGTAPTPIEFTNCCEEQIPSSPSPVSKGKKPLVEFSSTSLSGPLESFGSAGDPLILKNKAPRWHEQLQCWCLNFKGRVTVASVKNFQLVAAAEPNQNVSVAEQERVILQFGKIGKDIFTMDYRYPLSALQAFAICLSSFDTKPACE